jgi:hypothetical protein
MYAYFCFTSQDLEDMGVNMTAGVTIIGFDAAVDNTKHVHHFILQASFSDIANPANCSRESAQGEIAYPWAPGDPPFTLPEDVGFKLGGDASGYKSFLLEVHYDNVDLEENQFDSSAVEVYFTKEARQHTAGFLSIGDPFVALVGQPIDAGVSDYNFECPSECSSIVIQEPVTVLREYLHMHKSGYATYFEQSRNGQVIRQGGVEYYDFDQTGNPAVQADRYEIQPGDSFSMRCYYKNEEEGRTFGLGSSNEMCIGFLLYYPRHYIPTTQMPWSCGVGFSSFGLPQCETALTNRVLANDEVLNRTFGAPSDSCSAGSGGGTVGGSSSSGGSLLSLSSSSLGIILAAMALCL